jgi:3-deoxy-7-phosphoheptulonate synthase
MLLEDEVNIVNTNIASIELAPTSRFIASKRPLNGLDHFVEEGRKQVQAILKREDTRFLMVVGPCSIHDVREGVEYAKKLAILADKVKDKIQIVMRVYVEKPRTQEGWPGLFYDPHLDGSGDIVQGLIDTREIFYQVLSSGLLTATEITDNVNPQFYSDMLVYAAIGARTAESQPHRWMASGLSMPVGFKNSTSGKIKVAVDGAATARKPHTFLGIDFDGRLAILKTKGNPYSHIILRGGDSGSNYDEQSVQDAIRLLTENRVSDMGLVIDANHGNSQKDYRRQPEIVYELIKHKQKGLPIVGTMVESNLREGSQKIKPPLEYGVSVTDSCLGWQDTEQMIMRAYKML